MTLRAAIIDDTAQQMARLDMVFAEQTGRAIETVDFIVRNAIETLGRSQPPASAADFDALLSRRIQGVRQIAELAITDASGHVLYATHSAGRAIAASKAWPHLAFTSPTRSAGLRISPPFLGPTANGPRC